MVEIASRGVQFADQRLDITNTFIEYVNKVLPAETAAATAESIDVLVEGAKADSPSE